MSKVVNGTFTILDGERFYKIENYDQMEDFFMTITSASDIWNFCWSQGGVTAGRKDCDHAVFPYYTADKLADTKSVTGPYTCIAVQDESGSTTFWEPFAALLTNTARRFAQDGSITRNIYKNENGTKVWFEEVNHALGLAFRYGWTSSATFGVVRMVRIDNLGATQQRLSVLDGCQNIMCAATTATFQNNNSVLLDAYKQTDLDKEHGLAIFAVSSIVSDKAEPNEGLYANTCWFSTDDAVFISPEAPRDFFASGADLTALNGLTVLKGRRPACYCFRTMTLGAQENTTWYQVFDVGLTAPDIVLLQKRIADKRAATHKLIADIEDGNRTMTQYIASADGIQNTAATMTCTHHEANVMFNIMRGGVLADNGDIHAADFIAFVAARNDALVAPAQAALAALPQEHALAPAAVREAVSKANNRQLERLFLEYLPLTFSRRHGDPSRPWNRFNIKLKDAQGNPILNYEGNWRDIFQNWEALAMSYPEYIEQFCTVFLNAMTIEGFNPYRITRSGIDWEVPEPDNPWAQFGYWGDHQVIYLQKLLELYQNIHPESLRANLNRELYTTSNVPYRLKSYAELLTDPRNSLRFDEKLSGFLLAESKQHGADKKMVQAEDGQPALVSLATKLLQIVIAKAANLVPDGGIWMNTQRPEWNDANNALAGWGLSVVTAGYLYRMLSFLIPLFAESTDERFLLPAAQAACLLALKERYEAYNARPAQTAQERRQFVDAAGRIFQEERERFYLEGYGTQKLSVPKADVVHALEHIRTAVAHTLAANKRGDGLYHTYNTLHVTADGMDISPLQEMLEGQVSVLSSGLLSAQEAADVTAALKKSRLYETRQHSYMLYPNKDLPLFLQKNNVPAQDAAAFAGVVQKSGAAILVQDANGAFHFNADFVNARVMREKIAALPAEQQPTAEECAQLERLYEKTFNHQSFTGRSGTFYAYEGLGSIYWHMVSKLLLAVQENLLRAEAEQSPCAAELARAYYEVRGGLSFNKTPELYGAFPFDPYSHTPYHQGAKQPGMTGQVKEEVLTRWGELGVGIHGGSATFSPCILQPEEFHPDGTLSFTWCGTPVTYHRAAPGQEQVLRVTMADGSVTGHSGTSLPADQSRALFSRDGTIAHIDAWVAATAFQL